MKRDRDDLLRDALAHFEVMDRYAAPDTNGQLVIDAICMRLSAGLDVLAHLDAQIRAELFAGQWSLMGDAQPHSPRLPPRGPSHRPPDDRPRPGEHRRQHSASPGVTWWQRPRPNPSDVSVGSLRSPTRSTVVVATLTRSRVEHLRALSSTRHRLGCNRGRNGAARHTQGKSGGVRERSRVSFSRVTAGTTSTSPRPHLPLVPDGHGVRTPER